MNIPIKLNELATLDDGVVIITLARPDRANALDAATLRAVIEAMELAEREPSARAVVLCGSGRNFCAGADLKELSADPPRSVRSLLELFRAVTLAFERSPLIVVGAVHGAARAGGLELLLACDAVIAADNATLGDAHLANGLLPGGGSSARLPRQIGHARARWLILSAASITAEQALAWGLCLEVVPLDALHARATALAKAMAVGHRDAVEAAKRMLAETTEVPLVIMLETEIKILEEFSIGQVFKQGVAGFLSRKANA